MRIYIDGIFDLFHVGHIETLKFIKNMEENVILVVGIISDSDAASYKRIPIINEKNRIKMLESCKYIDEIIPNSPLVITKEFIDLHNLDLVVHGFANKKDELKQDEFFKYPKEIGKFKIIPYSNLESTTGIIDHILRIFLSKSE